jgi:iron complex outermembrane receptor protein
VDGLSSLLCCSVVRHPAAHVGSLCSVLACVGHAEHARAELDEIVVSATRQETQLQQTPMSIQALTGEELELAGIDAGRDLGIMLPNVVLNPGPHGQRDPLMRIRGLPGVTVYVDGIWLGEAGFMQRSFVELERVEVLLGPQGTLFGRNTNGGAVQLITRRPGSELGARADVQLGEFARRAVTLTVDLPIGERLKTKWTAAGDENAGFLEHPTGSYSLGADDNRFYRADFLWEPTENLSLRLALNDEDARGSDARFVRISNPGSDDYIAWNVLAGNPDYLERARSFDPAFPDPPAPLAGDRYTPETHEPGFPGGTLGEWQTRSDEPGPTATYDNRYATLMLDWELTPHFALESLTSHSDAVSSQLSDADASEFTFRTQTMFDATIATTTELQLAGNHFGGRLKTLVGLYYQKFQRGRRTYRWSAWEFAIPNIGPNPGTPGPPGVGGRPVWNTAAVDYVHAWGATVGDPTLAGFVPSTSVTADLLEEQEDIDRAFFGQLTWAPLDALEVTLGFRLASADGRYTRYVPAEAFRPTEPGAVGAGNLFAAAAVIDSAEKADFGTSSTPRFSIGYRPTGELYLYASYAEGFTSSEVANNPFGQAPIVLDPEIVTTREIGLRSDWRENRLRLNATLFDSRWDGLRVNKFVEDTNVNVRVPTSDGVAQSQGLEVEIRHLLGERFELDFGLGLLDTEYLDIGDPPPNGTGLQPGIPFQYAPETSFSLGARYRWPLSRGGEVLFAGAYGWMDEYQRANASDFQTKNPDGTTSFEPAYGILNARVVYQAPNRRWEVAAFGTNLTDEWYVNGGVDPGRYEGYDVAMIGRPRELGVGVRVVFD